MKDTISNMINKGPAISALESYRLILLLRNFLSQNEPASLAQFTTDWPLLSIGINGLIELRYDYHSLKVEKHKREFINQFIANTLLGGFRLFLLSDIEKVENWPEITRQKSRNYEEKLMNYFFQCITGASFLDFMDFMEKIRKELLTQNGKEYYTFLINKFAPYTQRFPSLSSLAIHAATGSDERITGKTLYLEKKYFIHHEKVKDNLIIEGFRMILGMDSERTIAAHLLPFLCCSDKQQAIKLIEE